ncbi:hypothetical protein C0992_006996 [Termitomyces sp. T32_za158]|nr:hypothetical protein C0992_006996 [Termitomyces sp. T32_za158]
MSSDSSLGVALVTGASTDIGRAIVFNLTAKNYDIAINDFPEALKPLEALKAQIEKEGKKSTIIAGDPLIESFWACIKPTIDAHRGHTETIVRAVRSPALWGKGAAKVYRPMKWVADQCSKQRPGAKVIGVFRKIGTYSRYALTLVIADGEGSIARSVPGAVPFKSAIRGLTEVAGACCSA